MSYGSRRCTPTTSCRNEERHPGACRATAAGRGGTSGGARVEVVEQGRDRVLGVGLVGEGDGVADLVGEQLDRTGFGARTPRLRDLVLTAGLGVDDDLTDVDRVDAVDQRLMGLGDDREPVVLQTLDGAIGSLVTKAPPVADAVDAQAEDVGPRLLGHGRVVDPDRRDAVLDVGEVLGADGVRGLGVLRVRCHG